MSGAESSSEEEWEDVEPLDAKSKQPSVIQAESERSLEIVVSTDGRGKRKSQQNVLDKAIAAFNRELRQNTHKVHLLCLLAHGLRLSKACDDSLLQGVLLSLVPTELASMDGAGLCKESLQRLLEWFVSESSKVNEKLQECCRSDCHLSLVQVLVAVLRSLGLSSRLVLVLSPATFKPPKLRNNRERTASSPSIEEKCPVAKGRKSGLTAPGNSTVGNTEASIAEKMNPKQKMSAVDDDSLRVNQIQPKRNQSQTSSPQNTTLKGKSPALCNSKNGPLPEIDGIVLRKRARTTTKDTTIGSTTACKTSPYFSRGKGTRKKEEIQLSLSSSDDEDSDKEYAPELEASQKQLKGMRGEEDSSSDCEIVKTRPSKRKKQWGSSQKLGPAAKKMRSSGNQGDGEEGKSSVEDIAQQESKEGGKLPNSNWCLYDTATSWVEVYVEQHHQWTSLHIPSCSVGQPKLCEKHCNRPLSYVIGIENDHCVCDVSARYASTWCTHERKQRLSEEWWMGEVLKPFSPGEEACRQEREDVLTILYSHPLPTSVSDYKSHPLYALRRHLLKFEAIYPEDSRVVGNCRGEPVYSRDCVQVLHTREVWLREGRVVRRGEQPYKVVKARKKKSQTQLEAQNSTVEVFGQWQTEEYMAPPVVDGKVPRNEYGNVELFQPSMLPPGAVHLTVPGIQRVARKLEVDFAPAMMGWDFHGGYCHPIIDGIVVPLESKQILLEAWEQDQQIALEKEAKKREKRVIERWQGLVKNLLIREREVLKEALDSNM